MHPYIAEFIGTILLLLLGGCVVANVVLNQTKGHNSGWIVISAGWGMAVFVAVACTGSYSGAHLNPAVSLGVAMAGLMPWSELPGYILAQLLGAMVGAWLVWLCYRCHFEASSDNPDALLGVFSTGPAISAPKWNLITEILGTMVLLLGAFYFTGAQADAPMGRIPLGLGSLGALPSGLLVFAIGLSLGGPTGYAINPARDLGPRIMHALLPIKGKGDSNWGYAWIPVAGPLLGAALATIIMLMAGR